MLSHRMGDSRAPAHPAQPRAEAWAWAEPASNHSATGKRSEASHSLPRARLGAVPPFCCCTQVLVPKLGATGAPHAAPAPQLPSEGNRGQKASQLCSRGVRAPCLGSLQPSAKGDGWEGQAGDGRGSVIPRQQLWTPQGLRKICGRALPLPQELHISAGLQPGRPFPGPP